MFTIVIGFEEGEEAKGVGGIWVEEGSLLDNVRRMGLVSYSCLRVSMGPFFTPNLSDVPMRYRDLKLKPSQHV